MFMRSLANSGTKSLFLFLLLVLFSVTCHGNQNHQLSNSCGDNHNISFPFYLQGDPSHTCVYDEDYTLSCDNNRTVLHHYYGKYYVQEINYTYQTIRLVDVGIQTNNICSSSALSSITPLTFSSYYDDLYVQFDTIRVVFLNCETPIHSPIYKNITGYCKRREDDSGKGYYSYVVAGEVMVGDVADSCSVEVMLMSSSQLIWERGSNLSVVDLSKELGYGFEASWYFMRCSRCRDRASCLGMNDTAVCYYPCFQHEGYKTYHWYTLTFAGHYLFKWYSGSLWLYYIVLVLQWVLIVIVLVFAARLLCVPCVFGFLIYKFSRRHYSTFDNIEGFLQSENRLVPIRYSYSNIKKMTNGFREKLGEGGYGSVYKGKLRSGPLVAIKMLSKPKANGQEFINEVATIGRIHHVNVVHLIGYCAERSKRALVYDFMPNGSLEKYIFSPEGNVSLSCEQIWEISLGVARGIEYLHQGCEMQILHFDIKPHNILLDEKFAPKVSDFGLAKLYPTDDSIVTLTAARGTLGYMAPELFYKNIGGVSYKADVYSFGMLLMEMAGRRRNWNSAADSSQIFFPSWVYDQFTEGRNVNLGETTEEEGEMVKKMMLVALWCIQMKPSERPSMNKVVEMLQGNIELVQMPPKPFLYPQAMPGENSGMTLKFSNLSGACVESITTDISGR